MKNTCLCVLLVFVLTLPLSAETSVWKVELNGLTTYLGGTCHILRASDYPLPEAFEEAYRNSEILVFETEIDRLDSPEVQQLFLDKGLYRDGATLEKNLSPRVYGLLADYCRSAGVPVFTVNLLKPPIAVLTLLGLELQRLGASESGVDEHFFSRAKQDGKSAEWVESVEQQVDFVFSMGRGNEDEFVEYAIRDLKETGEIFEELVTAWREGDEEKLSEVFVDDLKTDYPPLYQSLLVDRNRIWLPRIEEYLRSPGTEFILVGVAHLVGEDGILRELRNRGYTILPVKPGR